MNDFIFFVISILLIAGAFSSKLTVRFNVPVLMVLIGVGMLVGSDGLNLIYFDNMPLTQSIANFGLIFIIFESGFYTKKSSLKESFGPSMTLATLGIAVTTAALGYLLHLIFGYGLLFSLMIGAIISSTDAAAVIMIIRQNPIRKKVSSILEIESAANDPMAIMLTLLTIKLLTGSASANIWLFSAELAWQLLGGILIGFVSSALGRHLFNNLRSENRGHYYVLFIGMALFTYSFASIARTNGIIAIFFAGYWFGNFDFIFKMGVSHFIDGLSAFFNMAIFLLLGLLVFPRSMLSFWREGLIVAALLMFVVRPLAVFICTFLFKLDVREMAFISWGGIKGAVPVVLATYPAIYGLDADHRIFNIVFFAVLLSCLLQGTTINSFARALGLMAPSRSRTPFYVQLFALDKTDLEMIEVHISEDSKITGKAVRDLKFPADTLITAIIRGKEVISPNGRTVICRNDVLFILTKKASVEDVNYLMSNGFFPGALCAVEY